MMFDKKAIRNKMARGTGILALTAVFALTCVLPAQVPVPRRPGALEEDEVKMPNGKSQRDEIAKADYKKNLEESRELVRLSESLRDEIEKNDRYIMSLTAIKKAEQIEKIAKRIRGRMRRY
ncbi:MAG: hypothetical protein ABI823_05170 [Bryobacteraceae bacterium]